MYKGRVKTTWTELWEILTPKFEDTFTYCGHLSNPPSHGLYTASYTDYIAYICGGGRIGYTYLSKLEFFVC